MRRGRAERRPGRTPPRYRSGRSARHLAGGNRDVALVRVLLLCNPAPIPQHSLPAMLSRVGITLVCLSMPC
uniref:Uncharacterized protein n=1 Tax=Setaria viridis TaxID=4556 RepID=A0A4U6WFX5_SETVI|nr:hypothetical protein SEVIR_1G337950v2 [Setaria viridis]